MRIWIFLFLFIDLHAFAQSDSVAYSREYEFTEGIYLTAAQFRQNAPIRKENIISAVPGSELDFIAQVMQNETIRFKDASGQEQQVPRGTVWGYCQNRSIYINFNKSFNRVNVIGSLCHLVATVTTIVGIHDPMDYNYAINNTYDELRQFVYDTKSDQVLDFDVKNMEKLLSSDLALYAEFMKLSKRKKADSIFLYLRKYNENHPLYLPKN